MPDVTFPSGKYFFNSFASYWNFFSLLLSVKYRESQALIFPSNFSEIPRELYSSRFKSRSSWISTWTSDFNLNPSWERNSLTFSGFSAIRISKTYWAWFKNPKIWNFNLISTWKIYLGFFSSQFQNFFQDVAVTFLATTWKRFFNNFPRIFNLNKIQNWKHMRILQCHDDMRPIGRWFERWHDIGGKA